MNIKKISQLLKESVTNDDIIDCLSEYSDNNNLNITDGFIEPSGIAGCGNFTDKKDIFSKNDIGKTRKAKLVKILLSKEEKCIFVDGKRSMPISIIEEMQKLISEIERFNNLIDSDDEISFLFQSSYDGIYLYLIIPLSHVDDSHLNSNLVEDFLKEIKKALGKTQTFGKKRAKVRSNWLEYRFTNWNDAISWGNEIVKMNNGQCRFQELNEIGERIIRAGWKVYDGGGDKQLIIRLKKS